MHTLNRILLIVSCGILVSSVATAREILYVHNTYSGEISKVAIPEHEVIGTIEIGLYMDYVTASPDSTILYVNRIESLGIGRARNIGESGELIAIDTRTDEILWRVQLDGMPHHMTPSKDGKLVFVPYYDTWWVAVVDVEKHEVVKKIFAGHGSHVTRLSPDGKELWVGSMMNDTLTVIDTETLEPIARMGFPEGVRPFEFTKDMTRGYVQQSRYHGFFVINPKERSVLRTVDMPALPSDVQLPEFYPHNVNHGIKLSRDERYLFANSTITGYVAVYAHPELELIKTIPVGEEPNSIAFSLDGKYAYVTNRKSNDLSIISVERLAEVKRLTLGDYPQRMVVIDVPE